MRSAEERDAKALTALDGRPPKAYGLLLSFTASDVVESMATQLGVNDAVTEMTCGICLEDSKNPLNLPCGHSFCDGCLDEWRSRYGVKEEMRRKCPICRARIPPSKEMVTTLLSFRAKVQELEDINDTSSENYRLTCQGLEEAEKEVGADWDGVTVLQGNNEAVTMPDYIFKAVTNGDIKAVLKWINANRTEDRANAKTGPEMMGLPMLYIATGNHITTGNNQLKLMTLLLQLGAAVDFRDSKGFSAIGVLFSDGMFERGDLSLWFRLLLSWGVSLASDGVICGRKYFISQARKYGEHELANLLGSELGGRRCEIVNLTSRPELNGKTCVAEKYRPNINKYKVTLETKKKDVLLLDLDNLKRRDRTPQDCGYYIEFKNGRTIRHDFDSSEDCQAFVAALNRDETQPVVTEEAEARAEQAAAELLAELGLDDSAIEPSSGCTAKKSTKKKGGKKKKKK